MGRFAAFLCSVWEHGTDKLSRQISSNVSQCLLPYSRGRQQSSEKGLS